MGREGKTVLPAVSRGRGLLVGIGWASGSLISHAWQPIPTGRPDTTLDSQYTSNMSPGALTLAKEIIP